MKKLLFILLLFPFVSSQGQAIIRAYSFYVAPVTGDLGDEYYVDNTGTGDTMSTIAEVNALTLAPNDTVFFKRGCSWRAQLNVEQSGTSGHPIVFTAYGTGAKPVLNGADDATGWGNVPSYGLNTVTNGTFADATDWTNASIAGGVLTSTGNAAYIANAFAAGKTYRYTVDVVYTSGTLLLRYHNGSYVDFASITSSGAKTGTFSIVGTPTSGRLYVMGATSTIDNLVIQEVTATNVWGAVNTAYTAGWQSVVMDDTLYSQVATQAAVNAPREYFVKTASTPDSIFVWSVADPDTRLAEVSARNYAIDAYGQAYITVSYLEVRNAGHSGLRFGNNAVGFDGYAVADSVLAHTNRLGGINVVGDFDYATVTNCVATYNGFNFLAWGNEGGNTGPTNVTFNNCYSANTEKYFVTPMSDATGYQLFMADASVIEYCESYNDVIGVYLDPGGEMGPIVVTNTVRYNYIHNTNRNIVFGNYGIGINTFINGSHAYIYYNLIVDCGTTADYASPIFSQSDNAGTIEIYNNTIYNSATATTNNMIEMIHGANITIKNNIFAYKRTGSYGHELIRCYDTDVFVSDYNQFYKVATIFDVMRGATHYENLANWRPITSQDANSQDGDALFTTEGSVFTLQAGSPCLDQGVVIATIPQTDILGNPINGAVDIGAYEKQ